MPQVPSGEVLPVTSLLANKCDENILYQELTLAGMREAQVNCRRRKHPVKRQRHGNFATRDQRSRAPRHCIHFWHLHSLS